MRNVEDNLDITHADKEQRVFSDFQFSPDDQKDFKQDALQRRIDEVSGEAQKEKQREIDDYASYAEMAIAELNAHRAEVLHRIYGYEVSETDIRKAATNILDNFDKFADRFDLNDEDKDVVFEQILILQQGTPEQQEQALRELHAYDPALADAVLKEADQERVLGQNASLSGSFDLSTQYSSIDSEPIASADFARQFEYR